MEVSVFSACLAILYLKLDLFVEYTFYNVFPSFSDIDAFIDNMNAQEVQQEMEIVTVYESEEDARSEHGKDNGNSNPAVEQNLVNPEHAIENVAVDAVDVAVQVVEPPPEDMDARTAEKENACPQSTPIGSKGNASTSSVSVNPLASISVLAENHGDNKPSTQSGNILVLCPYCDMLFGKKASYRLHLTKEHMLRKKKVPGKFVKKRKRDDTEDEEDVNDQGDEGAVEDTGSNSQGDDNVVGAYVMMPMKNAMKRRKKNAALYYCKWCIAVTHGLVLKTCRNDISKRKKFHFPIYLTVKLASNLTWIWIICVVKQLTFIKFLSC